MTSPNKKSKDKTSFQLPKGPNKFCDKRPNKKSSTLLASSKLWARWRWRLCSLVAAVSLSNWMAAVVLVGGKCWLRRRNETQELIPIFKKHLTKSVGKSGHTQRRLLQMVWKATTTSMEYWALLESGYSLGRHWTRSGRRFRRSLIWLRNRTPSLNAFVTRSVPK